MRSLPLFRVTAFLLSGVFAPLLLTQCKTTAAKSYKDVSYDPAKLKTPGGHGMERKEYPFDEQGNYRKDWVKSNSKGHDRSASRTAAAEVAATGTTEQAAPASTGYPTYAEASAARASGGESVGPESAPAPAEGGTVLASAPSDTPPAAPATTYHKVSSGDTLFSLAGRYNTSVSELKRVNGLSGNGIRAGQSLRIP